MAMGSQRLYVGCKQMPDPSDNRLGELAQWQLVFIFLGELSGSTHDLLPTFESHVSYV